MSFSPNAKVKLEIEKNTKLIKKSISKIKVGMNLIKSINSDIENKEISNIEVRNLFELKYEQGDKLKIEAEKVKKIVEETNYLVHKMNSMHISDDIEREATDNQIKQWGVTYNNWFKVNTELVNPKNNFLPMCIEVGLEYPHDKSVDLITNYSNILQNKESSMSSISTQPNNMTNSFVSPIAINNKI